MQTPRYLTKSRFKLAMECPTKLFYTGKADSYKDVKKEDEFLEMLADGGFQVGELAKVMYPDGIEIKSKSHAEAEAETAKWLTRDKVILFEPAIRCGSLFVRVDILVKNSNDVEIIEVKAKSYSDDTKFVGVSGSLLSDMRSYVQDVAFQTYVFRKAYPSLNVSSFLMLPHKAKPATVDGLNQMFKIVRAAGELSVKVDERAKNVDRGGDVLVRIEMDEYVKLVCEGGLAFPGGEGMLEDVAEKWAEAYANDVRIAPSIGSHCGKCEFRYDGQDGSFKSGFHECWMQANNWGLSDFEGGTVLDIWNFRGKDKLISKGVLKLKEVGKDEFNFKAKGPGLSHADRQWMQISGIQHDNGGGVYLDRVYLDSEMGKWKFPYHFIDFETSAMALPFYAGMRPYEQIAFQFSHHVMNENGSVRHVGQYLSTDSGRFPNFDFAIELQKQLSADSGSVFMWHFHEATILGKILDQLASARAVVLAHPTLQEFLKSLIKGGDRAMIDLRVVAEKGAFYTAAKGSNSIKDVFPAVLETSYFLKHKYSKPIYGAVNGIPSLNFQDISWWMEKPGGGVENPYDRLGVIVRAGRREDFSSLQFEEYEVAEGGAAAFAYSRLQCEDLDPAVRDFINSALLHYCEVDTLAMVMIVESWRNGLGPAQ